MNDVDAAMAGVVWSESSETEDDGIILPHQRRYEGITRWADIGAAEASAFTAADGAGVSDVTKEEYLAHEGEKLTGSQY